MTTPLSLATQCAAFFESYGAPYYAVTLHTHTPYPLVEMWDEDIQNQRILVFCTPASAAAAYDYADYMGNYAAAVDIGTIELLGVEDGT